MASKDKTEIGLYFVVQAGNSHKEKKLRQAWDTLTKYIAISHKPEDKPLEILVEPVQTNNEEWIELSPKSETVINQIEFNPQPTGKKLRKIQDGLADVDYVWDAKCVEVAIGATKYRMFCRPGLKTLPTTDDSTVPTNYYIQYQVKGGIWYTRFKGEKSPAQQIGILDKALSTLRKYADLYCSGVDPSSFIRLALTEFNTPLSEGIDGITDVCLSDFQNRLDHIVFKQKAQPDNRAVALSIHDGSTTYLRIGKVDYRIEMRE